MQESEKIASLIESLDHPDKAVIRAAADSLIAALNQSPEIAEPLNRLLLDRRRKNLWPIAYILAHLPKTSPQCLQVLLETLGHPDPDIRWAVLLLLVRLGKKNPSVVAPILGLLRTGNPTQKRMAIYCIRDLKLQDPPSLGALLVSLKDVEPQVRVAGVTSLRTRPDISQEAIENLLRLLEKDPDARVRCSAALTLAQVGTEAGGVRPALQAAASSSDPQVKKAASAALDHLKKKGPSPPPGRPAKGGPSVD